MTRIDEELIKCKYCGTINSVGIVQSTITFDGPNLDLRPAPMASGLFVYSCYYCNNCNYSRLLYSSIDKVNVTSVIQSDEYQNTIASVSDKNLRKFLLAALNHKYAKEFRNAAYSYLYASWVFDDKCKNDLYNDNPYRLMAAKEFLALEDISTKELLILIDLLRRNNFFDKALEVLEKFLKRTDSKKDEKEIATIQKALIELKNNYKFRTTDFLRSRDSDYTPLDKVKKVLYSKNIEKEMILKGNRTFSIKGVPKYIFKDDSKKYLIFSSIDNDCMCVFEFIENKSIFTLKQIDNENDVDVIMEKYNKAVGNGDC